VGAAAEAEEVERLYRERYAGFTAKHFHEHLVRGHGFRWGYTWIPLEDARILWQQ
jgi:hypothetical protein